MNYSMVTSKIVIVSALIHYSTLVLVASFCPSTRSSAISELCVTESAAEKIASFRTLCYEK